MASPASVNEVLCGDCLEVLKGFKASSVDLIYMDPPFNTGVDWRGKEGTLACDAEFADNWSMTTPTGIVQGVAAMCGDDWIERRKDMLCKVAGFIIAATNDFGTAKGAYLLYVANRLLEMRRVLKSTGSLYLHCDSRMSHFLKLLLDHVFGESNFRNEIVWCYRSPSNAIRHFARKHDIILFYALPGYVFNSDAVRIPYARPVSISGRRSKSWTSSGQADLRMRRHNARGKVPEDWWSEFTPAGRLHAEYAGYPTQKPLALLERIIKASSDEGDLVLDPFCGSGTTLVAAERLGRRYVGIDVSSEAVRISEHRLSEGGSRLF